MNKKTVYLKFERFGLCNKIIMWAKAFVFSYNNNAVLKTSSWFHVPIGTILRGENTLRLYSGFFNNEQTALFLNPFTSSFNKVSSIEKQDIEFRRIFFQGTPYITDLVDLAPYRALIIESFFKMIKKGHVESINKQESPVIGVHIRRGDFNKIGNAIDISYYVNLINSIRNLSGKELAVTVFSDGHDEELKEILVLNNVARFKSKNDLVDLVVLSKSKLLITSLGSSYSYWAAFIGDSIVIHHPDTWVVQCRNKEINKNIFEGVIPKEGEWPELLISNINAL